LNVLVAGSSGFLGGILIPMLLEAGHHVIGIDKIPKSDPRFETLVCDLSNETDATRTLESTRFDATINLASQIDFSVFSQSSLFKNNVQSNQILLKLSIQHGARNFIFTSSNSIFLGLSESVIYLRDKPLPIDWYGKSKVQSEEDIKLSSPEIHHQIIRCPNLVYAGRVGMLSILFDLLKSDSTLWVIGKGEVRHQMLSAKDLCHYILSVLDSPSSSIVNLGSSKVSTMREMFGELSERVGSKSKIRSVPAWLALPLMRLLHNLRLSPLGPYQMRMLTRSFQFADEPSSLPVPWASKMSPVEMLESAYINYLDPSSKVLDQKSANQSSATRGIARILKWIRF
jgi:UDP-glucose 4-epimerase